MAWSVHSSKRKCGLSCLRGPHGLWPLARAAQIHEAIQQVEPEGRAEADGEARDEPAQNLHEPLPRRGLSRVLPTLRGDAPNVTPRPDLGGAQAGEAHGEPLLLIRRDTCP